MVISCRLHRLDSKVDRILDILARFESRTSPCEHDEQQEQTLAPRANGTCKKWVADRSGDVDRKKDRVMPRSGDMDRMVLVHPSASASEEQRERRRSSHAMKAGSRSNIRSADVGEDDARAQNSIAERQEEDGDHGGDKELASPHAAPYAQALLVGRGHAQERPGRSVWCDDVDAAEPDPFQRQPAASSLRVRPEQSHDQSWHAVRGDVPVENGDRAGHAHPQTPSASERSGLSSRDVGPGTALGHWEAAPDRSQGESAMTRNAVSGRTSHTAPQAGPGKGRRRLVASVSRSESSAGSPNTWRAGRVGGTAQSTRAKYLRSQAGRTASGPEDRTRASHL